MGLQIGIVGLPNAGKSTLYNALTRAGAPVASYPFTTIEPHHGVAVVPDRRLDRLAALTRPDRAVPAAVEFLDIAGLVRGASHGEGLGNQFLGHIRNTDAIALVLRCFEDPDVAHVSPEIDPLEDLGVLDLELTLADLATVERRIEKVEGQAKARPRDYAEELEFLLGLRDRLGAGSPARNLELDERQQNWFRPLNLLTAKPRFLVANVDEDSLPEGNELAKRVQKQAADDNTPCVVICAKMEAELAEWPEDEAREYRSAAGVVETGIDKVIRAGYKLLNLITFFTATGAKEVRSWPLPAGTPAIEAAGRIHTDMQRGFIRAEVVTFDDLDRLGSFQAVREKGLLRLEGRDYIVQDGDIIHFRFNV